MACEICLVREFASDEAKDALIAHQARQLDRLSHLAHGLPYVGPALEDFAEDVDDDEFAPEPPKQSTLFTVEAILGHEDIWRKPPRVAAPRLIERLREQGLVIVPIEELSHPGGTMGEPGAASTAPARGQPCVGGST